MLRLVIFITFCFLKNYSIAVSNTTSQESISFSCDTQAVLSVDKDGKLTQFLPGQLHFEIKNDVLKFGKIGYITDQTVSIIFVDKKKFYAFEPSQSLLYEDGLLHHVVSTFEGLTAVQAKCTINEKQ